MSDERHDRLTEIFLAASELPFDKQRAYLDEHCAGDPEMRARVEKMLQLDRQPPDYLEPGAVGHGAGLDLETMPERIGPYRVLDRLGEGGMGIVYSAEQEEPVRRRVALKLIKLGLETKEVIARFDTERQALALMNHPNVAQVHDAGVTEQGRPYFAMEHVEGRPITDYCDEERLDVNERLELLQQVCDGVQHAHQKGIIHRDIKASNVLVTEVDGKAVPKIIDFGIAKATERSAADHPGLTRAGQTFGTPAYMSPEQAGLHASDVDTRTDVYGLGVLLYELLAGSPPFEAKVDVGLEELRRRIREEEPPRPSARIPLLDDAGRVAGDRRMDPASLARRLRGDLDWIVMKALAKERDRRYGSPSELSADIERHLTDEPVLAGAPSNLYRARKFVIRHRTGVSFAAILVVLLAAFGVAITREARRADRAAAAARVEAARARGELRHAQGVSAFLFQLFEAAGGDATAGECASVCDLVDGAIGDLNRIQDEPYLRAQVMLMLGKIIRDASTVEEGRTTLIRALAGMKDDPATLDFIEEGAWLGAIVQRLDEAELTFEHLARVRENKLGAEDPETLLTRVELGRIYRMQNRLADGETLIETTLQTMRRVLGDDHPYTLRAMGFLASIYWRQGRLEDTGRLLEPAIDDMTRVLGEQHYITLATLYNLARVAALRGEAEQAKEWLRRAVDGGFIYVAEHKGRLVRGREGMREDPLLEPLHDDPEFDAIVDRAL